MDFKTDKAEKYLDSETEKWKVKNKKKRERENKINKWEIKGCDNGTEKIDKEKRE